MRIKLIKELADQGHTGSGALIGSVDFEETGTPDNRVITFSHNKYGIYLEYGVKASKIPYGGRRRRGKRRSKYIEGLKRYVKRKNPSKSDKEITSIAFAIAKTQKKEGMPTRRSYAYSKNNRRKQFGAYTLRQNLDQIRNMVLDSFEIAASQKLDNVLAQINAS